MAGKKRPSPAAYYPPPSNAGHKRKSLAPLFCVSLILWVGVIVVGIVVGVTCVYTEGIYIVRLTSNHSEPVQVSLGYAGTCVNTTQTSVCISHLSYDTDESLAAQFQRKLDQQRRGGTSTSTSKPGATTTSSSARYTTPSAYDARDVARDVARAATTTAPSPDATLEALLDISDVLSRTVFPLAPPVAFLVVFVLSTLILWFMLPGRGARTYKIVLTFATLINTYGLTLGFMVALATRQACKSLMVPGTGDTGVLDARPGAEVYVTEGDALQALQWAVVAVAAVVQICVAWLFVLRRAAGDGAQITILPTVVNNFSFAARRRCCCF